MARQKSSYRFWQEDFCLQLKKLEQAAPVALKVIVFDMGDGKR